MAQLTISRTYNLTNVTPSAAAKLIAKEHGWKEQVPNPDFDPNQPVEGENVEFIDNPQTAAQKCYEIVDGFIIGTYKAARRSAAKKAADEAAEVEASSEIAPSEA